MRSRVVAAWLQPALRFISPMCLAVALACEAPSRQEPPDEAESYSVVTPTVANVPYEREYVGEIQAAQRVELRPRMKGVVEAVAVDEGQKVKQGQLLFSISARELQQELSKARAATASALAELKTAQIEQASTKMLFDRNIVADSQVEMAESKIRLLEAKVEESRALENQAGINLTYSRLTAPFDGVINRLPKKVGSLVTENDLLTTLTNTSEVFVYFRVSEQEYLEYTSANTKDQPEEVSLRLANGVMYPRPGVIDAIENEIDRETGNLAFRARFPNPDGLLKHGSTGTVVVRSELKDGLMIPQASTFEIQDQLYVYTVGDDNTARARKVVPRLRLKDAFVIESGLDPDERIITEGIQKLRDGSTIAVRPRSSSASTSL
jgi:membrane fusion protein (multidrug efflux system)